MVMKKSWVFLLFAAMVVLMAACGGASEPVQSGQNEANAGQNGSNADNNDNAGAEQTAGSNIQVTIDSPVEIEFWHAMTGHHEQVLQTIADQFNESQEFITVKLVGQGSYGDLSQKLTAAARARTLPAMSQAYEDWVTEYIRNNLVIDLTPYITDSRVGWSDEELNDIVEVFREANQWDGQYYSLPFNKSTRILFYNKGLFEEHGVKVPTTWEEMRDAAEKLTLDVDGDGRNEVIGMGFENSVTDEFSTFVIQAGGVYLDEESLTVRINSDEGRAALNFINDMLLDGVGRLAGEDGYMSNPFGRGDVAMYIGSSAGIPFVAEAAEGNIEFDATVLPAGVQAATPFAGTSVTVFDTGSDEQKLAAWEFIKFLINTENTAYWAEQSGYLPVRYSALALDSYVAFKEENPMHGVGEEQFDAGFYTPKVLGATAARNAISPELEAVLAGQKSVDQGLADAEAAANDALARANNG